MTKPHSACQHHHALHTMGRPRSRRCVLGAARTALVFTRRKEVEDGGRRRRDRGLGMSVGVNELHRDWEEGISVHNEERERDCARACPAPCLIFS